MHVVSLLHLLFSSLPLFATGSFTLLAVFCCFVLIYAGNLFQRISRVDSPVSAYLAIAALDLCLPIRLRSQSRPPNAESCARIYIVAPKQSSGNLQCRTRNCLLPHTYMIHEPSNYSHPSLDHDSAVLSLTLTQHATQHSFQESSTTTQ